MGCCPCCRQWSTALHGWYHRQPQDLPCHGKTVRLDLQVRRFRCVNASCPQSTFAERFPDWLPCYARRTTRLTGVLRRVAFQAGGEAGRYLAQIFKIVTSGDTLLRVIRSTPLPATATAKVIGIDDWAMKKGRRYGTIVVNLETHQVIELLPERNAKVVEAWLKGQPQVQLVARDRAAEYALGIQAGAPQATQVADRWHLLVNIREMVERLLSTLYQRLQQLPVTPEQLAVLAPKRRTFRRTHAEQQRSQASRERRLCMGSEPMRQI